MEKYKCRTCLRATEKQTCIRITENCVNKTIKESIIQLVPEMESTLMDSEVVCNNCYKTLRSCMKFISRCLKIEFDIQESITKQLEALNNMECSENYLKRNVNLDHDYFGETENVPLEDCPNEDSDLDISELNDFPFEPEDIKVEVYEDGNDFINSFSEYSQETESKNAIQDDQEIKLEDCLKENSMSVECEICKEIFTDVDSLKKHEIVHDLTCKTCFWSFPNKKDLNRHQKLHDPFICDKCGKSFIAASQLVRHQSVHVKKQHICEICGKSFPANSALEYHKISHRPDRSFMCDKCPRRYKSQFNLKRHVQQYHEKTDQYQCQKCGILVGGRQTYAKHYRLVHLQLKPFVCDVCGREFGRKDYLQKHMYYHTGEPRPVQQRNKIKPKTGRGKPPKFGIRLKDPGTPVNCKICGKLILSVHLLKSHLQSHVKIKRHKCRYCELTFTLSNNRDRHQRIHEADPEKKFRCNICWKKMKTEAELEHHIVGHYNRPPQHSCDICGEKFHRKYLLDNHHLDKHTDPGDIERAEKEIVIDNLLEYAHPNDLYELENNCN